GYGELQTSLLQLNKGDFAKRLFNVKDMQEAMDMSMEELAKEKDPYKRRQLAEVVFGTKDFSAIAGQVSGQYRSIMAEIQRNLGTTTDAQVTAAKRFEATLSSLKENLDGL